MADDSNPTALIVGASRGLGLALAAEFCAGAGTSSQRPAGGHEVYRASKSALNQLFRSFAARHVDDPRTLLLIHPGHVKTELGGAGARLTVDESARGVVDTILARRGEGGLQFLDYENRVVPW